MCERRVNPTVTMLDREEASGDKHGGIADAFAKAQEFIEVTGFSLGTSTNAAANSLTRKTSLASWTNYYWSLVMKPAQIIQKLFPTISQFETLGTDTLKKDKPQLIRQLNTFKVQFDKEFQTLIE